MRAAAFTKDTQRSDAAPRDDFITRMRCATLCLLDMQEAARCLMQHADVFTRLIYAAMSRRPFRHMLLATMPFF